MTPHRLFIITLILLLPAGALHAEAYTLQEAVSQAISKSDSLAAAQAKSDGAKARADEALLFFTPKLTLSGGWTYLDPVPYTEIEMDITEYLPEEMLENPLFASSFEDYEPETIRMYMARQNNFRFQLQGEQILFGGTALIRQRAMEMAKLKATREEERITRHEVTYQVEEAFWKLALAREAVAVTGEAIETAQHHVALLSAAVRAGVATEADRMSARVQLASLKLSDLKARQGAELAENAFRTLVHIPAGESIELETQKGQLDLELELNGEALTRIARDRRPELRALDHQLTASHQGAAATWASWLPQIALRTDIYLKNPNQALEDAWYWSTDVTLGFQWNLWDRGAALQKHRQARAGVRQLEAVRRQLRDGIKLEIDQSVAKCRQASEQLVAAREAEELARENLRLQQLNFKQGTALNVNVLEAQTALSKARLGALEAETQYRIARAGLRRALGLEAGED